MKPAVRYVVDSRGIAWYVFGGVAEAIQTNALNQQLKVNLKALLNLLGGGGNSALRSDIVALLSKRLTPTYYYMATELDILNTKTILGYSYLQPHDEPQHRQQTVLAHNQATQIITLS